MLTDRYERALGVHRVLDPAGVLPQAARRLDADPAIGPDEVRIAVQRLNLDAASFRQLSESCGGDGAAVRAAVLDIVATRGKMQNPVTGSGGMLIGVVDAVGPESPLGLSVGDRVATLVSLTLTPLRDHRRAGPLGRPVGAGPGRGDGDPVRPLDRRRPARRPARRRLPRRPRRLRGAGRHRPRGRADRRALGHGARARRASPAACRLAAARAAGAAELTGLVRNDAEAAALPRRRPRRPRRRRRRHRPARRRRGGRRARRRHRRLRRRPGRRTRRRSWPRPRGAPWSSSPWRRRSRRRPWARRGWRRT